MGKDSSRFCPLRQLVLDFLVNSRKQTQGNLFVRNRNGLFARLAIARHAIKTVARPYANAFNVDAVIAHSQQMIGAIFGPFGEGYQRQTSAKQSEADG